ncbi:cutinase family protein [Mycobacterium sp. E740]|uniref:cutinase family protein n=1 Tax=Mycobacterium sp. E740 TaxID=1834149 RepID=UPI0018D4AFD4|nr:cutinase family protein [Mycobacterium sp. E740]
MRQTSIKRRCVVAFFACLSVLSTAVAVLAACASPETKVPVCPDVEVVFARGLGEPPGVGAVGQAFVDSLRSNTGRDVGEYGVNYPADKKEVTLGVADMNAHIDSMVVNCPGTELVVGGYSLGGAVTTEALREPQPSGTDRQVAAVVIFGNGSKVVGVPVGMSPQFADKTIDLCNPQDPVCSEGPSLEPHLQPAYIGGGAVRSAVDFAVKKLNSDPPLETG